jgi:hypothetical protein
MLAAVGLLVFVATAASATSIPVVQVRNSFEGVLTEIGDEGNLLDGQLQVGGPFHGVFSYTSTSLGPDWTAFNELDPGLTLVGLFAFLGENLLYRANQIPERGRPLSLTLALSEDLHIVEPCGGYLSSPLPLSFELCLRLEFFNAIAPDSSTPTSVFDLAQWDTARFFLYPMGAMSEPVARFDESAASNFLVAGSITHTVTTVTPVPEPGAILLVAFGALAVAVHCGLRVLLGGSLCHHVKREASRLHPIHAHDSEPNRHDGEATVTPPTLTAHRRWLRAWRVNDGEFSGAERALWRVIWKL